MYTGRACPGCPWERTRRVERRLDESEGHMAAVPLTFCEACRQYRAPWRDRIPAFCSACGRPVMQLDRVRIAADRDRIRYLLDEIHAWSRAGLIDGALCERL